tara:strand:- start:73 stop:483 length:411 start_codon:yes stop_codon:yes gene_type:complete
VSFSPSLLKILGTNISHALIDTTRPCEQRLFQAIIVQAFEDALNPSPTKTETYYKIDAHNWFMYPDTMFEKICWLAGFDPDIITDRYKRLQDTGQVTFSKTQKTWVEYRKLYKDYRSANCSSERKIIMERIRKLKF